MTATTATSSAEPQRRHHPGSLNIPGCQPVLEGVGDNQPERPGDQRTGTRSRGTAVDRHRALAPATTRDLGAGWGREVAGSATAPTRLWIRSKATITAREIDQQHGRDRGRGTPRCCSRCTRIRTEVTSVPEGQVARQGARASRTHRPLANERVAPATIAGVRLGRITRRKVVNRLAPSDAAASSTSPVELLEHRLHTAHDERQGDEEERQEDRPSGVGDVDAQALSCP